jgi:hypothetical protein
VPKKLIFDDELLRDAVATSVSFWMVARKLRPHKPNGIYKSAQRRIRELRLDTSHFTSLGPMPTRWTNEQLRAAVCESTNFAQVIRKLGLVPAGGNYDQIQRRVKELGLDTSHFNLSACGWAKGLPCARAPIERALVANRLTSSHKLKQRLFRARLREPKCEICGWAERAPDGRIPVELDHINGDRFDNRLENLRILCPNCHSLQSTHRGLNKKSVRVKELVREAGLEPASP